MQCPTSTVSDNSDLEEDNRQIQGESHQQKVLTTEREQRDRSSRQHPSPIQQPNKNDGYVTVRQDKTPNSSKISDANNEEKNPASQELSDDDIQKISDDRQSDPESMIIERNTTESAARATVTSNELQQKALETQDLIVSGSKMIKSKKYAQGKKDGGRTLFRKRKNDTPQEQTLGDRKGKKNQKKERKERSSAELEALTTQPPPSLQQVKPEAGVTVVFHVLLASNFNMTEESFFIRAHDVDLGDFEMTAVEVLEGQSEDELTFFRGQFTISLDRARQGTLYKYVVVKEGNVHWEQLPEFPPECDSDSIVNRFLKIPDKYVKPGASWNQFDGVAYVYGDKDMFSRMWPCLSKDKMVEYRVKALLCFLPKWSGFFVNETTENMDAKEAIVKLDNVVKCLHNVWIEERGRHRRRQPIDFDVQKALTVVLEPKMKKNRAILTECKVGSIEHVSAVVSSLAITLLVKKYTIELESEKVKLLLNCLSLEADPTVKRCSAYEAVLAEFSTELKDFAASAIESLCNQLMKDAWTSNPEWILAVPLLHFLRGDSKPFEEPDIQGCPETLAWWGAQRLNIRKFQRFDQQPENFSEVWSRLASAFDVDRLLKRTCLYAFPVWRLPSTGMFHISDLCVALVEFFPRGFGDKEEKSSFKRRLEDMINMLDNGKETNSSQTKAGEFTVTASLKLAEVCLENLSFRDDIDLICLAIRLLFSSIHQWQSGPVDCETDDKVNKTDAYLREDCVRKISKKVVSKLRGVPESNMELQVQIIL
ncbi:E3 ubiquitin-protein ligase rnf213-alpha-like isoform X2 [Orbicella faveolata]|uniref:E3 ubiquitin-protein ligase rnf213-alpha-like isoform X2 n=1 Tax=Orbicella faveolata TaxID=48498 RepID=UPI0009E53D2F|nr:E3 ubiquitin-protein ligase rnf213-alpha-like isoform X2 [Orbicella faveolata]